MKYTDKLGLPIWNKPETDVFDIGYFNEGMQAIDDIVIHILKQMNDIIIGDCKVDLNDYVKKVDLKEYVDKEVLEQYVKQEVLKEYVKQEVLKEYAKTTELSSLTDRITTINSSLNNNIQTINSQLYAKPNEGIEKWIKQANNKKSIYFAGDSTSDETIPYNGNSPTKCLYDRMQKVGVGEGFPLEGVAIRNGFATSGCTSKDYLNGTAPATERNLNKLLNALRSDDRKYKLVILSLGLNNSGDDTFESKYRNITQIINKILEIENTFILLRMPNPIAGTDDLTHSNLMRDLYIALDNDKHPRTSLLHTQKLLWGEEAGYIPTRGYNTNTSYPQWCVIVEDGKAWKPTTYGTTGTVKPNFSQGVKNDTLTDGTVVWTCIGKGTDLFLNAYHPSQKGFEKLADLIIEVLTDKSKLDTSVNKEVYDCYVDTNPLFDVYKGTFVVNNDYDGIINKIEKGDIIQVGNTYSEIGTVKNVYKFTTHDTNVNAINYGEYVYINGYTWRCVYAGTANFSAFPSLDDTVNINKTVFANGTATFALECKGEIIEVDADGVTPGKVINGAYRKRLRIYKKKVTNVNKYKVYKGIVKSGNAEVDKMFLDAGFTIEIKTDLDTKEKICLGFTSGTGFYLYKDNASSNSISKPFNYTNGYHTIEKAGWSDVDFEAQFFIKDYRKIDTSKLTGKFTFSSNTYVTEFSGEKTIEEHLRYLYSIS